MEGEGEAVVVGGVIKITKKILPLQTAPGNNAIMGVTPKSVAEAAVLASVSSAVGASAEDNGGPNFGWAAVGSVQIHIEDLPFVDDGLEGFD